MLLRKVHFHNIFRLESARLPWIRLTDLSFGDMVPIKVAESLDILQKCPNLKSCVFLYIKATSLDPPFRHAQILHSSLRSLRVRTQSSLSKFLDCLTLPALRDIHVTYRSGHPQFVSLLARSQCRIERFVIDTKLTPHYFTQCCENMPHLVELDIRVCTSSASFRKLLQRLTLVGNGGRELCPVLRVLRLSNDPPLGSRYLVNMVHSRNEGIPSPHAARIECIHVSLKKKSLDMLADLKDIRNKGVELYITDSAGTRYDELLTTPVEVVGL